MNEVTVLVVDDDKRILYAFEQVLAKEGFRTITARDGKDALSVIAQTKPDVVFMDIAMQGLNGLDTLAIMKERGLACPVVIITGFGTMETAIKAMQQGAFEYITKPLDVGRIREVAHKALASSGATQTAAREQPVRIDVVDRYELIGKSKVMQEVYKLIGSVSTTPNHTSVLIQGESGTGKELVAREIHAHGPNAGEPFVAVNCTAFPETLLESELFGHEKGAFTGAGERKPGKFEVAAGGTIFLDEIGDLSLHLQQKLLRVLQEREFERLGSNQMNPIHARFITATNRDLTAQTSKGAFREDLFFRLNVAPIHLPPLRERKEDIPLLAKYFLSKYNEKLKKSISGFSTGVLPLLQAYDFPGNVRELENLIERAVMLTKGEIVLTDVFVEMTTPATRGELAFPIISSNFAEAREHIVGLFERQFIIEHLRKHQGNVTAAAKATSMTRQNFQRLMKKHKLKAGSFKS